MLWREGLTAKAMHDSMPYAPQVDQRAALAALDGSRELLRDMALIFSEDAPLLIAELHSALKAGDASAVERAIHSLKGMAATFYARPTVDLIQRYETIAAQQKLAEIRSSGAKEIESAVKLLIDELASLGLL